MAAFSFLPLIINLLLYVCLSLTRVPPPLPWCRDRPSIKAASSDQSTRLWPLYQNSVVSQYAVPISPTTGGPPLESQAPIQSILKANSIHILHVQSSIHPPIHFIPFIHCTTDNLPIHASRAGRRSRQMLLPERGVDAVRERHELYVRSPLHDRAVLCNARFRCVLFCV